MMGCEGEQVDSAAGLERALALVGFMGSGARNVARGLSARTGLPLHDLQRMVESEAGMSWARLLLEGGPDELARAEARALDRALGEAQPGFIALSHSALMDRGILEKVLARTRLVYLERPLDVSFEPETGRNMNRRTALSLATTSPITW